jgi:hypothetical protein
MQSIATKSKLLRCSENLKAGCCRGTESSLQHLQNRKHQRPVSMSDGVITIVLRVQTIVTIIYVLAAIATIVMAIHTLLR